MAEEKKTVRLLDAAAAVSDSDLFPTRQGADTVDTKQTAEAIKTYVLSAVNQSFDGGSASSVYAPHNTVIDGGNA